MDKGKCGFYFKYNVAYNGKPFKGYRQEITYVSYNLLFRMFPLEVVHILDSSEPRVEKRGKGTRLVV